jgi:hypothetical protein
MLFCAAYHRWITVLAINSEERAKFIISYKPDSQSFESLSDSEVDNKKLE